MRVFMDFVKLTIPEEIRIEADDARSFIPIDNHFVSVGMIDQDGNTFYGEFREFDPYFPALNDSIGTNAQVSKIVEGLRYKDFHFIDNVYPVTSISKFGTDQDSRYCFAIKGWAHQILFEMDAWIKRIYDHGDPVEFYASPASAKQWVNFLKTAGPRPSEDSYSTIFKIQAIQFFEPINPGIPWDHLTVNGKPLVPPTGINAMDNVIYSKAFYEIMQSYKS